MRKSASRKWQGIALTFAFVSGLLVSLPSLATERYLDKIFTCSSWSTDGADPACLKQTDIVYGQAYDEYNSQQTIDLTLDLRAPPASDSITNRPVIIWAHGGGDVGGDKDADHFLMEEWTRRGFVTASINYRLCPTCTFGSVPAAVYINAKYDMQMAVRYVREHAAAWGIDPNRIVAAGHSSGAASAYGVTYDAEDDNDPGPTSSAVAAGVMLSVGSSEDPSIFHYPDTGKPPAAIFVGANDYDYGSNRGKGGGYLNNLSTYQEILSKGVPAELSFYPLGTHYLYQRQDPSIWYGQDFLQRSSDFLYRRLSLNNTITLSTPQAFISQTDLRFATNIVGYPAPPAETIKITNVGGGSLNWSASNIPSGMTVTPTSGSNLQFGESTTVSIQLHPSPCPFGSSCEGVTWGPLPITINTPGAAVATHTVNAYLKTTDYPAIQVRETAFSFATNTSGFPAPPAQTVTVENVGGGILNWSASTLESGWTSLINGTGPLLGPGQVGSFQVFVTPSAENTCRTPGIEKACGPYTVTVSGSGVSQTAAFALLYSDRPKIGASTPVMFHYLPANGQTGTTSTYFTIRNIGGGTLVWQATHACGSGATLIPSSGSLASNISQTVELRNTWNPGTTVGAFGGCFVTIRDNGSSPAAWWPSETITVWGVATN